MSEIKISNMENYLKVEYNLLLTQKQVFSKIQEILFFLNENYDFYYDRNNDGILYKKSSTPGDTYPDYTVIAKSGIAPLSNDILEKKDIFCPPDILWAILFSLKSCFKDYRDN
jgi:hypothetical protein